MKTTNLYSIRHNFAFGWHYKHERECDVTTAQEWLEVFRNDEPGIAFVLSKKMPTEPLNDGKIANIMCI